MDGGGPGFVGEEEDVAEDMDDRFTVVDFPDDYRTGTSCWPLVMKDDGSLGAEKPVDEYHAGETHGPSGDFVDDVGETQRKEELGEKEELEEEQEEIMKAEEINSVVVGQENEEEKYNHVRPEEEEEEEDGDDDHINDDDDEDEAEEDEEEEAEEDEEEKKKKVMIANMKVLRWKWPEFGDF
ncbi:hypothetical protein EJ110_NYTH60358 [Nymphaea thermarum]|nr:hypothetical protein EJ110_NYTH60358 [Nymphaea thermarum]